jgi:hypothetical protein
MNEDMVSEDVICIKGYSSKAPRILRQFIELDNHMGQDFVTRQLRDGQLNDQWRFLGNAEVASRTGPRISSERKDHLSISAYEEIAKEVKAERDKVAAAAELARAGFKPAAEAPAAPAPPPSVEAARALPDWLNVPEAPAGKRPKRAPAGAGPPAAAAGAASAAPPLRRGTSQADLLRVAVPDAPPASSASTSSRSKRKDLSSGASLVSLNLNESQVEKKARRGSTGSVASDTTTSRPGAAASSSQASAAGVQLNITDLLNGVGDKRTVNGVLTKLKLGCVRDSC